ncbi:MAG: DUF4199 domain-containing protein [Prevotella sp.]|nr:DUF4199 domain-containing protein [Prevotella sp.]MCI7579687.1 DUF4199 domain-containing protein [Prevotella sp.]
MTTQEYIQLRAFARVDGTYVGILWIASFACYLGGLSSPMLGFVGGILAVASPFFAAKRLIKFRDDIRDGEISGRRSMLYYALMFFYASLLFALAQYLYFAFLDGGYLMREYTSMLSSPEMKQAMQAYGMTADQLMEGLKEFANTSPIMTALNIMTMNITIGLIFSLPVSLITRRARK